MSQSLFESTTCSRCGGSGHYSYCLMYGTRCFRCGGRGWTLTKRGAEAQRFYTRLLSVPAMDIKPGMKIFEEGFSAGSVGMPSAWYVIERVQPDPYNPGLIMLLSTEHGGFSRHTAPDALVRVAHTQEEKRPKIAEALAYQATLTKLGKPRKASGLDTKILGETTAERASEIAPN